MGVGTPSLERPEGSLQGQGGHLLGRNLMKILNCSLSMEGGFVYRHILLAILDWGLFAVWWAEQDSGRFVSFHNGLGRGIFDAHLFGRSMYRPLLSYDLLDQTLFFLYQRILTLRETIRSRLLGAVYLFFIYIIASSHLFSTCISVFSSQQHSFVSSLVSNLSPQGQFYLEGLAVSPFAVWVIEQKV